MTISQTLFNDLGNLLLHTVYASILIWVGFKGVSHLTKALRSSALLDRVDPAVASYFVTTANMVLKISLLVASALIIGIPGSAFITLFGSAAVAIGLALQGSLSNLAGGLMLMFFHPFGIGDYIKSGNYEGTVTQISAFYTTIVTIENGRIVLPNGHLTNDTLINFSAEPKRMLNIPFSVSYDSDIDLVRSVILMEARTCPLVLHSPEPTVPLTKHDESALVFSLRAWVLSGDFKPAEFELLERVKRSFDSHGITIPYPQMDIHMN